MPWGPRTAIDRTTRPSGDARERRSAIKGRRPRISGGNGSPRCIRDECRLSTAFRCRPVSGLAGLDRSPSRTRDGVQWLFLSNPHRPTVAGAAAAFAQSRVTAFPFHPPSRELLPPGGHLHYRFYSRLI
jgi:hypothetical protein